MSQRPDHRMRHFEMLTPDEQRAAICRLAKAGFSDHGVASATGLAVEQIRQILGEARALEVSQ